MNCGTVLFWSFLIGFFILFLIMWGIDIYVRRKKTKAEDLGNAEEYKKLSSIENKTTALFITFLACSVGCLISHILGHIIGYIFQIIF